MNRDVGLAARWTFIPLLVLGTFVSCSAGFFHAIGDCGGSTSSNQGLHACLSSQRSESLTYLFTLLGCWMGVWLARVRRRFVGVALFALFVLPSAVLFGLSAHNAPRWQEIDAGHSNG